MPAITGLIALSNDRAAIVAKSLVKLRHTFSRNSNIAWNREELALKPTRLSYRGSPDWAAMPDVFEDLEPEAIKQWMNDLSFQIPELPPKVWLSCPHCGFLKDVKQTTLFGNGKWTAISCLRPTCRKTATSRKWCCPCNMLWHSCPTHAGIGHACKAITRPKSAAAAQQTDGRLELVMPKPGGVKRPKRPLSPHPAKKARRSQSHAPVLIRPLTNPGPAMRAKFPRLFPPVVQ